MAMVLAGGILGFWAALAGFWALDLSAAQALAIWALSGPVAAAVALALALIRPAAPAPLAEGLARA